MQQSVKCSVFWNAMYFSAVEPARKMQFHIHVHWHGHIKIMIQRSILHKFESTFYTNQPILSHIVEESIVLVLAHPIVHILASRTHHIIWPAGQCNVMQCKCDGLECRLIHSVIVIWKPLLTPGWWLLHTRIWNVGHCHLWVEATKMWAKGHLWSGSSLPGSRIEGSRTSLSRI